MQRLKNFFFSSRIASVPFVWAWTVRVAVAQISGTGQSPVLTNPLKVNTIAEFITSLLGVVTAIAVPFAVFFMIYAGFQFVMAQGNEEKLKTARDTFLWTVIGIAILLSANVLANVISGTITQLGGPAAGS